jgi:hypothetical protein
MAQGLLNMLVSVVVVLSAPLAVTAMAASGVSPGDALEAVGVDVESDDPVAPAGDLLEGGVNGLSP